MWIHCGRAHYVRGGKGKRRNYLLRDRCQVRGRFIMRLMARNWRLERRRHSFFVRNKSRVKFIAMQGICAFYMHLEQLGAILRDNVEFRLVMTVAFVYRNVISF
jgi:hypothetical protein